MVTTEQETIKRIDLPELVEWFQETGWRPNPVSYVQEGDRSCCLVGGIWLRDHNSVDGEDYPGGAVLYAESLGFERKYVRGLEHGFMGYEADEDDGATYRIGLEDGRAARAELIPN